MDTAADPVAPAESLARVRPRLRHDVLFADTGDGVLLRNPDGGFIVRGRTAYRLTAALVPHLTGESSLGDLCAGLSPPHRRMVTDLVRNLLERGFARDSRPSGPVDLSAAVLHRFGAQLNYVAHHVDDAGARFTAFRTARVLVAGGGPIATAAALSLLRNGAAAIDVSPGHYPDLSGEVEALLEAGSTAAVRPIGPADADLTAADLAGYAAVVVTDEGAGAATVRRLTATRGISGPVIVPVTLIDDLAVIGPLVRPDAAPCWECAMLRLGANLPPAASADLWRDVSLGAVGRADPSRPVAAMVGNLLAFEVFRHLTGCLPPETAGSVIVQNLDTLEATRETLLQHPRCTVCAAHQSAVTVAATAPVAAEPASAAPETPHDDAAPHGLPERHARLIGRYMGVLNGFDDARIDQSPIKVGRVRVGPVARLGAGSRTITAFDLDNVLRARERAVRAALTVYVGQAASLRDTEHDADHGLARRPPAVPPESLSTWSGLPVDAKRPRLCYVATSLVTGRMWRVPVAAVHPFSTLNQDVCFEPTSAGSGAGADLNAAIRSGLLSALAYESVRDAAAGVWPAERMRAGSPPAGSELEFLGRTADNLGVEVELLALTGGPAPCVLARTPSPDDRKRGPLWTVACGLSYELAVVDAVRDLLGRAQLTGAGEPDPDLGDPLLTGLDARTVPARAPGDGVPFTASTTVASVLDGLRDTGRDALLVVTSTPDIIADGDAVCVRVLLAHAGS